MTVLIKIDQAAAPAGVPGQAREDLVTGIGVTLTAVGGPFLQYQWSIVSKPINIAIPVFATSLLGSPTANVTTLNPIDVAGTYLVEVAVDSGSGLGAGAGDVSRITFYAGPPLASNPSQLPRRTMAAFETLEHNVPDALQPLGNTEGWSREWYRWFNAIETSLAMTIAATASPTVNTIALRNASGELSATGFTSGPSFTKGATLTTTDATPTPIVSIPFADDAVCTFLVQILMTTPGTGIRQQSSLGVNAVTTAGVLTTPGTSADVIYTSYVGPQPGIDVVYAANVLTLRAVGLAATTIKWVLRLDALVQLSP